MKDIKDIPGAATHPLTVTDADFDRQVDVLVEALNTDIESVHFHTHLLTDEDGTRLAKRHDALAIRTLRQQGLTPAEVLQMAALRMTTVTSDS